MAAILKSGTGATAGTITVGQSCSLLMIKATSAGSITVNAKTIALAQTTDYQHIPVDFDDFVIVSGTHDYICLG